MKYIIISAATMMTIAASFTVAETLDSVIRCQQYDSRQIDRQWHDSYYHCLNATAHFLWD